MSHPNILLIVLDSVRARNVGAYDYHRETTPFLSEYAERASLYQQARAPGIHSVASHASLWTGAPVESHGIVKHEDELKPDTTIWEELSKNGYKTGIFTTNPVVAHASNLSEQFETRVTDEFVNTEKKIFPEAHGPADVVKHEGVIGNAKRCLRDNHSIRAFLNSAHHFALQQRGKFTNSVNSPDIIEGFKQWNSGTSEPWAACVNLMDAHFPYEPAEEYNRWGGEELVTLHQSLDGPPVYEFSSGRPWWQLEAFEHLYDGAILQLDSYLKSIISFLKDKNEHENTLIVITSDHGEGFGEISKLTKETKMVTHSWGIHEVLTHVPLVVKYPNQKTGEIVDRLASLVAFPKTVKQVVEEDISHASFIPEGHVVSFTTRLREEDDNILKDSKEEVENYYGPWRAVYKQEGDTIYKYIKQGEKYISVVLENPEGQKRAEKEIGDYLDTVEKSDVKEDNRSEVDPKVKERLTEMGYL